LHNLLCTEIDNSAIKGHFFTDIGYPIFGSSIYKMTPEKRIGFDERQVMAPSLHPGHNYLHGDYIPILKQHFTSENSFIGGPNEVLFLPNSNDGGLCNDFDAVKFGRRTDNGCLRMIHNLSAQCTTYFGIDHFIGDTFGRFHLSRRVLVSLYSMYAFIDIK